MSKRVLIILLSLDILANALTGGAAYQTICCRIGLNMQAGGWLSRVPFPGFMRRHFDHAVYTTIV